MENNLNEAIYISQVNDVAIIGNIIIDWTGTGIPIHLDRASGCVVQGNQIVNSAGMGITLSGSSRCVVANNVLKNIGTNTNNTYIAIQIQAYGTTYSTHNIIQGNQIFSDASKLPKYGINEADTNEDYNVIANNIVTNCATAAINKQGVNSILDNNITS
jgi:parallel beta-helix repeat protein